jgi:hypothetical protein
MYKSVLTFLLLLLGCSLLSQETEIKGDISAEDILLRIRQMETQFSYYFSGGFSYTLGSIYNNVVNPRFGSYF